jgi:hypothetical protein
MFKFLDKLLGMFNNKPNVDYIAPKTINVYFKNSLEPTYILLNVSQYKFIQFEIIQKKDGDDNVFSVVANLENVSDLELAIFETRKEAEDALLVLRNKLFAFHKSTIKLTGMLFVLFVLGGLLVDFSGATLKRTMLSQSNQVGQVLQNPSAQNDPAGFMLSPTAGPKEMQELQRQLEEKSKEALQQTNSVSAAGALPLNTMPPPFVGKPTQEGATGINPITGVSTPLNQAGQAPQAAPALPEVSGNPDVNSLVNSLGK